MKVLQNQTEEEVTLWTAKFFSDCLFYCLSYFPNFPTVKNGYNFKLKWSKTTDVLHLTTKCDWYVLLYIGAQQTTNANCTRSALYTASLYRADRLATAS